MLLLFGLALVLNVNTTAAATTNNTTITTSNNTVTTTAITNSTVKATTKTVAKPEPKITSINPVGNAIVSKSQNIKITYNETIKAGSMWIVLTNSAGTVISTKDVISGKTLTIKRVLNIYCQYTPTVLKICLEMVHQYFQQALQYLQLH